MPHLPHFYLVPSLNLQMMARSHDFLLAVCCTESKVDVALDGSDPHAVGFARKNTTVQVRLRARRFRLGASCQIH